MKTKSSLIKNWLELSERYHVSLPDEARLQPDFEPLSFPILTPIQVHQIKGDP